MRSHCGRSVLEMRGCVSDRYVSRSVLIVCFDIWCYGVNA